MDKVAVSKIIDDFAQAIKSKGIKINQLVLFGSFAKGAYKEGSDIDLVVISEDFEDMGYWERINILSSAIYDVFEPIEAVAMSVNEWKMGDSLIGQFARSGVVVYKSA